MGARGLRLVLWGARDSRSGPGTGQQRSSGLEGLEHQVWKTRESPDSVIIAALRMVRKDAVGARAGNARRAARAGLVGGLGCVHGRAGGHGR